MSTPELKLKFDAVYYHVSDMERSIAFYRDILRFRLVSRDYVARFDLDGVLFELVPNPPGNVLAGSGNPRLSLGVTDIQRAIRDLKERGVATTSMKPEPGGRLSFFKDPDRVPRRDGIPHNHEIESPSSDTHIAGDFGTTGSRSALLLFLSVAFLTVSCLISFAPAMDSRLVWLVIQAGNNRSTLSSNLLDRSSRLPRSLAATSSAIGSFRLENFLFIFPPFEIY